MRTIALAHTDGSAPAPRLWLQTSVKQFFTQFNWDNQSPALQEQLAAQNGPLDMTLSVSKFFGAIAWEGTPHIAAPTPIQELFPEEPESNANLTLDDFSSLF